MEHHITATGSAEPNIFQKSIEWISNHSGFLISLVFGSCWEFIDRFSSYNLKTIDFLPSYGAELLARGVNGLGIEVLSNGAIAVLNSPAKWFLVGLYITSYFIPWIVGTLVNLLISTILPIFYAIDVLFEPENNIFIYVLTNPSMKSISTAPIMKQRIIDTALEGHKPSIPRNSNPPTTSEVDCGSNDKDYHIDELRRLVRLNGYSKFILKNGQDKAVKICGSPSCSKTVMLDPGYIIHYDSDQTTFKHLKEEISRKTCIPAKHLAFCTAIRDIHNGQRQAPNIDILDSAKIKSDYTLYFVSEDSPCQIEVASQKGYLWMNFLVFATLWITGMIVFKLVDIIIYFISFIPLIGTILSNIWSGFSTWSYLWLAYPDFRNTRYLINMMLCYLSTKNSKEAGFSIQQGNFEILGINFSDAFKPIIILANSLGSMMIGISSVLFNQVRATSRNSNVKSI